MNEITLLDQIIFSIILKINNVPNNYKFYYFFTMDVFGFARLYEFISIPYSQKQILLQYTKLGMSGGESKAGSKGLTATRSMGNYDRFFGISFYDSSTNYNYFASVNS
jgi:hypothetical protein